MTLLIPTDHELRQLPDLRAFLRRMEPQPPEWFDTCHALEEPLHEGVANALKKYGKPGDVIVWGEEWWMDQSGDLFLQRVCQSWGETVRPASTMPVELARYTGTVAECRPVEVSKVTAEDARHLGFVGDLDLASIACCLDWQANNPTLPFAKSWAWWIDLEVSQ